MILLSLLGEQPIPNLLPLWQDRRYTATQFAATRVTLPLAKRLAAVIRNDTQLNHLKVEPPLLLEAYDIGQARAALAQALVRHRREGREVCLNLTGGTKLMSLAALQAAFGSGAQLLYVSTEVNQLIYFASDGAEQERREIAVKISAAQYLAAHGLEVSDNQSFAPPGGKRRPAPRKTGDALEEHVFRMARQSRAFDDVRRGIFIRRKTERGIVVNELDVVVTRNGRLAVCSCKSGGAADADAIYQLSSLSRREAAGIYCGKVLASNQHELSLPLQERARASNVLMVDGKELPNVAEYLKAATR